MKAFKVLLPALLLAAAGCHPNSEAAAVPVAAKTISDPFNIAVGGRVVHMQIAVTQPEMEHGLMFRRDLGPDDGMIFVYSIPQRMNFWMRNTPTPLDIGFFDGHGILREIYPMYAFDEKTVSSIGDDMVYALEMNLGWFARTGVRPGVKIDAKALAAALRARGFDPKVYGL